METKFIFIVVGGHQNLRLMGMGFDLDTCNLGANLVAKINVKEVLIAPLFKWLYCKQLYSKART
ncbi:hypothetical protein [Bacillus pseudomycoides]|uniref:hypothetical protein n=1 Tax=Bacillus pseudomycoides TaxID=64104 RepID=UPI001C55507C|nr:hypothetical protein [Bacillus pseudomycoides]